MCHVGASEFSVEGQPVSILGFGAAQFLLHLLDSGLVVHKWPETVDKRPGVAVFQ